MPRLATLGLISFVLLASKLVNAAQPFSDPAPLPEDVIGRLKSGILNENRENTLDYKVKAKLSEWLKSVKQFNGRQSSDEFARLQAEISALRAQVVSQLQIAATSTPSSMHQRSTEQLQRIESSFDKLLAARSLSALQTELVKGLEASENRDALPPLQIQTVTPTIELPAFQLGEKDGPKTAGAPAYLRDSKSSNKKILGISSTTTARTTFAAAALSQGTSSCNAVPADLDANTDVALTPEIQALAAKLEYSPARIYQYVHNEIKFEPYYGSLKGSQATLISGAGGPTDQASLLIALLRASNIPARYVKGKAVFIDHPQVLAWLGTKTFYAAAQTLVQGNYPLANITYNENPMLLKTTHVWVEACVPYGNYRGLASDTSGYRWIPLDPSFKDRTSRAGIATNVAFDYDNYLGARTYTLPNEYFAQQINTAIKSMDSNNALTDVSIEGVIKPRPVEMLPLGLPYQVENFVDWGGGIGSSETAVLPDEHRYTLTVSANASTASPVTKVLSLPSIALQRLTFSFKGATAGDVTALANWRKDGNLSSASPCTINVLPVFRLDGVEVATGSTSIGFCSTSNTLSMQVDMTESSRVPVPKVSYSNLLAANIHALQAYAFQGSDMLLASRTKSLVERVRSTSNPNDDPDGIEGEYLHIAGLKYMRYCSEANKQLGELVGGTGWVGNHLGLTSSNSKVEYILDTPYGISRKGWTIDAPGMRYRGIDTTTGKVLWKDFLLSGYANSAFESYIWQENAKTDAVSTVTGLQFARSKGIDVFGLNGVAKLSSANWATENVKLTSNGDSSLNYSVSDVNYIKSYIDLGFVLTIPRSKILFNNWKGTVFTAEKPSGNQASYIIYGGYVN